jgi:putative solute:sodium symporter small subunit
LQDQAPPVDSPQHTPSLAERRLAYWLAVRRLTARLLAVWLVFGLGLHYFARELSFSFFGWPFSFWLAAQGSLLVFALLIAFYAWSVEKLDRLHGFEEGEP